MQDQRLVMLEVWRAICRHTALEESLATIGGILADELPVDRLAVAVPDEAAAQLLTWTAELGGEGQGAPSRTASPLPAATVRRLRVWARRSGAQHLRDGAAPDGEGCPVGPAADGGEWLAAPLGDGPDPQGVLQLRARAPQMFAPEHLMLFTELQRAFATALENDHRLRELSALRAAAEADKRSALSRLGRADLTDTIVGVESGLEPVMARVALVARSGVPVLILGESGTGKEVIARAIHEQSPRRHGPFLRVNCGAIPPELIDSELFGHEKGAFTGATASRRGWFERADQGTLLLDEVGELPLPAQVRLLRVLQEGTFERVGGERDVKVDVRIVASTHRDLPALVQNGRFREDLWYRIAGFPVVLPPLRERRQDIPALAAHFARRAAMRFGLRLQSPTAADLALLSAYAWPGNVRELASVVDRAAILGDGAGLQIAAALGAATSLQPHPGGAAAPDVSSAPPAGDIVSLDEAVRRHVAIALAATHGRIEGRHGAAKLLGVNPHTLRARLRKLGVAWATYRETGNERTTT
ncbi:MAG: sigma 54-interacting transcriptional regulator [Candidatus Latescibacteria bacterium]|nr:sigma 54-interacting transcriptional regulator [Candidatus Latescibacterota bacterium]